MVSSNSHGRKGVQIHFARNAVGITLLLLAHDAWSRPMQMTDSFPAAQAIVDGNNFAIIDFNDWPSFSRVRERAAQAIARRAMAGHHRKSIRDIGPWEAVSYTGAHARKILPCN